MARSEEDLFEITLDLTARISLDRERIEADPIYQQNLLLASDPEAALQAYLEHYIERDRFLRECPSTNGPGQLTLKGLHATQSSE